MQKVYKISTVCVCYYLYKAEDKTFLIILILFYELY